MINFLFQNGNKGFLVLQCWNRPSLGSQDSNGFLAQDIKLWMSQVLLTVMGDFCAYLYCQVTKRVCDCLHVCMKPKCSWMPMWSIDTDNRVMVRIASRPGWTTRYGEIIWGVYFRHWRWHKIEGWHPPLVGMLADITNMTRRLAQKDCRLRLHSWC